MGRTPTLTIYDATKFVKQGQANRLQQNESTANRNINNNSIRNNVRKSNESVTSQENSNENNRFPITRNRFHPLSTTKQPSTTNRPTSLQITTITPATTIAPITTNDPNPAIATDQRHNRIPISSRFGTSREQNTSVRINKFLRQPTYTSRENNQQTLKRVNVTHNGSANRDAHTTSQEVIQCDKPYSLFSIEIFLEYSFEIIFVFVEFLGQKSSSFSLNTNRMKHFH